MDNKAQISIEYLVIVSVLMVIVTVVALFAVNLFGIKESIKLRGETFTEQALEMIK